MLKIFWVQDFLGAKIAIGQKNFELKNLWGKKIWVHTVLSKKFESKIFLASKNVRDKKNFVVKKYFLGKKILALKIHLVQQNFG